MKKWNTVQYSLDSCAMFHAQYNAVQYSLELNCST